MEEELEVLSQLLEGVCKGKEATLNLSHRNIKVIPADIAKLTSIKILLLNDNKILMPPEEISHLKQLESLSLEHNQLTVLPSGIVLLSSTLLFLNLSYNPLTSLSPACCGPTGKPKIIMVGSYGITQLSRSHLLPVQANALITGRESHFTHCEYNSY